MYHQHTRSAIPKVVGILMIIFASLGLIGGLVGLVGGGNDLRAMTREIPELQTWRTVELLINVLSMGIGALHLYAGFRCLGYKSNAPSVSKLYGILAIAVTIINVTVVFAWAKPILEKALSGMPGGGAIAGLFGPIMLITALFAIAWPVIVLALMTRPSAKSACVNEL